MIALSYKSVDEDDFPNSAWAHVFFMQPRILNAFEAKFFTLLSYCLQYSVEEYRVMSDALGKALFQ
jgi:hypothetical protein